MHGLFTAPMTPSPGPRAAAAAVPAETPRVLVSLATYNEAGNLRALCEAIRATVPSVDLLVVDDNSPDGTGRIADEMVTELPGVHAIHRTGKLGLGTAIIAAMKFAVDNSYDYYINLDADFSHPPRFIPALLAGMTGHKAVDVMIGSRYIPGGGVEGEFGPRRKFMSTGVNMYARLFLGLHTQDNSGSFRCYRVSKLKKIDFSWVRSRGYSFQEEILFWCKRVGCTFGETPILFENRRAGQSKLHAGEAVRALEIMFALGMDRLRGKLPDAPPDTPPDTPPAAR
jgi:dolichol-phosphate mannosyltransferase